jgi:ABC-type amino acid transport substrate-binding protein
VRQRRLPLAIALAVLWLLAAPAPLRAGTGEISILVLKEHGVGSSRLAEPYVDRFTALIAQKNGWGNVHGQYFSTRNEAQQFIAAHHPQFGMLSLGAFLALRGEYGLKVVGRVASTLAGGGQYFIVSKSVRDLAGCKGKTLASDHAGDPRFIDRVVARGAFRLANFKLVQNQRPLQSIYQVLNGEADCALIDDAQLVELKHLDTANEVGVVWKSAQLPPMPVVAFPNVPEASRKGFQASLHGLCQEEPARTVCQEVGIQALDAAGSSDYAKVVSLYGQ